MQNLSILCNAEALKRQHRETEHFFQNEHSVKTYIQNTVCVRACHMCGGEHLTLRGNSSLEQLVK